MSGLPQGMFPDSIRLANLGGWALRSLLSPLGLSLWDLKWEFARDGDQLVFVDTIDTDSFRATLPLARNGQTVAIQFNKQSIRDAFTLLHPDWLAGVNDAKTRSRSEGRPFPEILSEGQDQGDYPSTPELPEEFLDLQGEKTAAIDRFITGSESAEGVRESLLELAQSEINFYERQGLADEFATLNRCD